MGSRPWLGPCPAPRISPMDKIIGALTLHGMSLAVTAPPGTPLAKPPVETPFTNMSSPAIHHSRFGIHSIRSRHSTTGIADAQVGRVGSPWHRSPVTTGDPWANPDGMGQAGLPFRGLLFDTGPTSQHGSHPGTVSARSCLGIQREERWSRNAMVPSARHSKSGRSCFCHGSIQGASDWADGWTRCTPDEPIHRPARPLSGFPKSLGRRTDVLRRVEAGATCGHGTALRRRLGPVIRGNPVPSVESPTSEPRLHEPSRATIRIQGWVRSARRPRRSWCGCKTCFVGDMMGIPAAGGAANLKSRSAAPRGHVTEFVPIDTRMGFAVFFVPAGTLLAPLSKSVMGKDREGRFSQRLGIKHLGR